MRYDVIVFKDYNDQVKLAAMPREAKARQTPSHHVPAQRCACDWDYAQGCPAYLGDEGGICETLHPIHYTIIEDRP